MSERLTESGALDLIKEERVRQIVKEGWTPEHDDEHEPGHLLRAGVYYLWAGTDKAAPLEPDGAPLGWPWEPSWWKPKDRRSNLIRAGALMLAEEERYLREGYRQPPITHVHQKLSIVVRELIAASPS